MTDRLEATQKAFEEEFQTFLEQFEEHESEFEGLKATIRVMEETISYQVFICIKWKLKFYYEFIVLTSLLIGIPILRPNNQLSYTQKRKLGILLI